MDDKGGSGGCGQQLDSAVAAFLKEEKAKLSKMKDVHYDELKLQPYLSSSVLNTAQKRRMIMTPDNMGKTQQCKLCELERDEMSQVLSCVILKLACPYLVKTTCKKSDAYRTNEDDMNILAIIYQKVWKERERLLNNVMF